MKDIVPVWRTVCCCVCSWRTPAMDEYLVGELQCPVCLELLNWPIILPCSHVLCRDPCAERLFVHGFIRCPVSAIVLSFQSVLQNSRAYLQVLACCISTFGPRSLAACAPKLELSTVVSHFGIQHSQWHHIFLVLPTGAHSWLRRLKNLRVTNFLTHK